jgi:hypothetical protein
MENFYFAMDFVKRYTFPKDYPNLILVNKEVYSIFKSMEHVVHLNKLLYRGGWFSIYTQIIIPGMSFLDILDSLIYSLEKRSKRNQIGHKIDGITAARIKRSPGLKGINLLGY